MRIPAENKSYASPTEAKQAELLRALELDDDMSQLDSNTRYTMQRITLLDIEETDRLIYVIERAKRIAVEKDRAGGGA